MLTREQLKPLARAAIECAERFDVSARCVWLLWLDALGLLDSLI